MPASKMNENFTHKQVIRYNGSNVEQVSDAMEQVLKGR